MGVYQSKTEPKIKKKVYREIVAADLLTFVGRRKIVNWMRKSNGIPVRVKPSEALVLGGWEFRFDWYEVETD